MGRLCVVDASLGYGETDQLRRHEEILSYKEIEELYLYDDYGH